MVTILLPGVSTCPDAPSLADTVTFGTVADRRVNQGIWLGSTEPRNTH
jgi:hypothetical protein